MSEESAAEGSAVKRRYDAPRRAAKAAETRRRIVAAAHELFVTRGYLATTVDDVAAAAGVSRPTVFVSTGGKPELLHLVRDVALAGDDEDVAVSDRPSYREVWDEPDPRRTLALYARNLREIGGRVADIEFVLQAAAKTDPELEVLARQALEQRREGCRRVAASVAGKATLREGMTVRLAADVIYAITSPDTYRLLTGVCSWSPQKYERWLADILARELLGPG
jgi:AcrR family transcriptional regulator